MPIRILVGKPGLDGHDRGVKIVATALRDAGCEVIYTGLRTTPEIIVATAIQESCDIIGLSILSGAHVSVCLKTLKLLADNKADIPIIVGGVIPEKDRKILIDMGIKAVVGQEATLDQLVTVVKEMTKEQPKHNID